MRKFYTFEEVKKYFEDQGCKLLETKYKNTKTKMKYICKHDKEKEVTFANFKKTKSCCYKQIYYTFEEVKKYFEDQGCKLLETGYISNKTKMRYICKCGNESKTTFWKFRLSNQCSKCSKCQPYTFEEVKKYFEDQDCKLLETEYKNVRTKMRYICKCGNESEIVFANFKYLNQRCKKCCGIPSYTFEQIKEEFIKKDCILLETEYISNKTKMRYICKCGNENTIRFDQFRRTKNCNKCPRFRKPEYDEVKEIFLKEDCILLEKEYKNCSIKMKFLCSCKRIGYMGFYQFKRDKRCQKCKNKTEIIMLNFLETKYENISSHACFKWCMNKRYLPFDILLRDQKIIIEVDGAQHFKQVSNWRIPENCQEKDVYKMKCALDHDYKFIRIFQEDIFNNSIDWKFLIQEAIENCNFKKIQYISKDPNIYDSHKDIFDKFEKGILNFSFNK